MQHIAVVCSIVAVYIDHHLLAVEELDDGKEVRDRLRNFVELYLMVGRELHTVVVFDNAVVVVVVEEGAEYAALVHQLGA